MYPYPMYLSHVFRTTKQEETELPYPHRSSTPVQVSSHICFAQLSLTSRSRSFPVLYLATRAPTLNPTHNTFNHLNTLHKH
jgi:hypothetical protein